MENHEYWWPRRAKVVFILVALIFVTVGIVGRSYWAKRSFADGERYIQSHVDRLGNLNARVAAIDSDSDADLTALGKEWEQILNSGQIHVRERNLASAKAARYSFIELLGFSGLLVPAILFVIRIPGRLS